MHSSRLPSSWLGRLRPDWVVVAAALGALVLGGLQSVAWHGADAPGVAREIAALLDPALLLEPASKSLAQPSESYFGYGRLCVGVYVLLALAALPLRASGPVWLRRIVGCATAVALSGDLIAYWLSESAGPGLRRVGFWYAELPALLLVVGALSVGGIVGWRAVPSQRRLVLCLPVCLLATFMLGYLPHGLLLGLAIAIWVARIGAREDLPPVGRSVHAGSATLCIVLAIGLATPYRPVLRSGPQIARLSWPGTARVEGARLHVFVTGYNRMSWWLVGRDRPWRPVPAFVLEDPRRGLLVFDTGFSDAVAAQGEAGSKAPERWLLESRSDPSLVLPTLMRAAGLHPERVYHVALSHLHGDHTGQLAAFSNARIVGGPGSSEKVDPALSERWQEASFGRDAGLGPFDEVQDLLGDGRVVLIRGGGHTEDGMMLLLTLDEGPILLAGDAVVHREWLWGTDVQRIAVDANRAAEIRNRVRAFLEAVPGASVAYGHDVRDLDCSRRDIVCHEGVDLGAERLRTDALEAAIAQRVARTATGRPAAGHRE